MKKFLSVLCTTILILGMAGVAGATSYTFNPSNYGGRNDLYDLDHYRAVSWGIDDTGIDLETETITKATLSFDNIRNWDRNTNDLYIRLFDSVSSGVSTYYDGQAYGDYFEPWGGIELHHYHNLSHIAQDITYEFDTNELTALGDFLSDGLFGLTFDADCHFWNDGVSLEIETTTAPPPPVVPEPGTILLMGLGLVGLVGLGRRRFKK